MFNLKVLVIIFLNAIWTFAILLLVGTVIVSGIKAATNQCGIEYRVPMVGQNWFCPKGEEK